MDVQKIRNVLSTKARGNYKVDNGALYLQIVQRYEWRSTVIKSKEEQERIMIACMPRFTMQKVNRQAWRVSRISNQLTLYVNRIRAGRRGGGGGGGGGGGIMHPCDLPNTSGEGRVGQINTSGGRGEGWYQLSLVNTILLGGGGGIQVTRKPLWICS